MPGIKAKEYCYYLPWEIEEGQNILHGTLLEHYCPLVWNEEFLDKYIRPNLQVTNHCFITDYEDDLEKHHGKTKINSFDHVYFNNVQDTICKIEEINLKTVLVSVEESYGCSGVLINTTAQNLIRPCWQFGLYNTFKGTFNIEDIKSQSPININFDPDHFKWDKIVLKVKSNKIRGVI